MVITLERTSIHAASMQQDGRAAVEAAATAAAKAAAKVDTMEREIARLRDELASALVARRVADENAAIWRQHSESAAAQVRELRDLIPLELAYAGSDAALALRKLYLKASQTERLRTR